MRIGTIGAGAIAQAVARHALAAGHEVVLSNSRGGESLAQVAAELGPGASAGTVEEAAAAELVVLAVPWRSVPDVLDGLPAWDGRTLVDATNQFLSMSPTVEIDDLGDETGSERVASLAPGAHVIKAFNTLFARELAADPRRDGGQLLLFYAGDDADAKARLGALVEAFGFAPVDLGPLRDGGRLMQVGSGPLSGLHALKLVLDD